MRRREEKNMVDDNFKIGLGLVQYPPNTIPPGKLLRAFSVRSTQTHYTSHAVTVPRPCACIHRANRINRNHPTPTLNPTPLPSRLSQTS